MVWKRHRSILQIQQDVPVRRAARAHALGHFRFADAPFPHQLGKPLPRQHAFDRGRGHVLKNAFLGQKALECRAPMRISSSRASSCVSPVSFQPRPRDIQVRFGRNLRLLDEPVQQHHLAIDNRKQRVRAMRFLSVVRTSYNPCPRDLQTGMPMGQPNSTTRISSPIALRSVLPRVFSHSRTGSAPPSPQ